MSLLSDPSRSNRRARVCPANRFASTRDCCHTRRRSSPGAYDANAFIADGGERFDLQGGFRAAIGRGATTLYFRAGAPASARVDDRIQQLSEDIVDAAVLDEASAAFARGGDGLWQSRSDGEWVRDFHDLGNVSCRMFSDHHGFGLVLQMRPHTSPRMLHKHIPRQVRAACEGEGLIVVSAPTEAAVESLAVALADWSGRHRGGYLISLQRRSLRGEFPVRSSACGRSPARLRVRRGDPPRVSRGPDILLVTGRRRNCRCTRRFSPRRVGAWSSLPWWRPRPSTRCASSSVRAVSIEMPIFAVRWRHRSVRRSVIEACAGLAAAECRFRTSF